MKYLEKPGSPITPHQEYFYAQPISYVYVYDRAEDGPECEIITRILAKHDQKQFINERMYHLYLWHEPRTL